MATPLMFLFVAPVMSAAAVPVIAMIRAWRRRGGLGRNADERCALCGTTWITKENGGGISFLSEGQLVCDPCAPRMRRRTITTTTAFLVAAGSAFYFCWGPVVGAIARDGLLDGLTSLSGWAWLIGALPPLVLVASADWTLRTMHRDKARALTSLVRAHLARPLGTEPNGQVRG
jgi:hypothetical protein